MSKIFTISGDDIIQYIKLSCQIPSIIEGIMTRRVITSAVAEAGIKVELEELQQAADNIRLVNKLLNADDTWAWLQKHRLSLDEFEELAYTNVISEKLAQHLFADRVEPFFIEHQLNYAGVVMYEVILDDEDLALELFYAVQEGEIGFHEVAHQYIQDTELRRSGGYRGILRRPELRPEISAAVFAATPPQLLKPVVTSKGTHLILVEEIIQPQLDEQLRYKILSDLFSEWLKQQIEQLEVVISLESSD
jgi:parvulin-like peptidyl-prolyl isomerase